MKEEIEYSWELKKNFLEVRNSQFKGEEYYSVIMDIDYDSYDHIYYTPNFIYIDTRRMMDVKERGIFGSVYWVKKEVPMREQVGIYAIKNRNGLFEMTTGKELTLREKNNSIRCFGINRISDNGLEKVANDLKLLNSNPKYKNQFINSLMLMNNNVTKKYKMFEEYERSKNSNIEYLKSYKLPHNY